MLKVKLFILKVLLRKEEEIMAAVYATLIVKGLKTFEQVPAVVQPKVREILIALELDELAQ